MNVLSRLAKSGFLTRLPLISWKQPSGRSLAKLKRRAAREEVDQPQIIYGTPLQDFLWRTDLNDTVV